MSNILTSNKLINSIKRRAFIPSDQNTFQDTDFLDILNEEIQYFGIPHLLSVHEEYLVYHEDVDLVANQVAYTIPYRAIGNKLRDVAFVNNEGTLFELSRISLDDIVEFNDFQNNYTNAFYVKNNEIILLSAQPFGNSTGKLRMHFYLRPNTLVEEDRVGIITNIDRNTGIVTISDFPEEFSVLPLMDFIGAKTPNKIHSYDIQPLSVNSVTKTVTFDIDDIPSQLSVGDYINLAGETIVPQLPTELHAVLCQRAAVACLESMGDAEGLAIAQGRLDKMEKSTLDLIDNRVEGAPQKIMNRHSPLQQLNTDGLSLYRRRGKL